MKTEEELIYMIWETVRAGQINQDDDINERLMRAYLQAHRAKHILKNYQNGEQVPDECFQYLPDLNMTRITGTNEFEYKNVPKTIRLNKWNTGMFLYVNGINVPIVKSEEYDLMKYDEWNKYKPRAKMLGYNLKLNMGEIDDCVCDSGFEQGMDVILQQYINDQLASGSLNVDLNALLVNPSDAPNYQWNIDSYPFPDEYIEDLINSVLSREFNIFLRAKADEVTDISNEKDITPQTDF